MHYVNYRFLKQEEQSRILKEKGVYMIQFEWNGTKYLLYELEDFYVEAMCNSKTNVELGFRTLNSLSELDYYTYLRDIDISVPGIEINSNLY